MTALPGPGRLLLVAHHFPPDHTIGSFRPRRIAIQLRAMGWSVDVVSARPMYLGAVDEVVCEGLEGVEVHRTHAFEPRAWLARRRPASPAPSALASNEAAAPASNEAASPDSVRGSGARAFLRWIGSRLAAWASLAFEVPDRWVGWVPFAAWAGLRCPRPDVVLATAPGFSNFLAGWAVSARLGVPLVLDYRDPWNAQERRTDLPRWRRRFEDRVERRCLKAASALVTTTPGIATELREQTGRDSVVVSNACEPERLAGVEPEVFDRPTLVYAGGLYGDRTCDAVLSALAELRDEGRMTPDDLQVVYLGRTSDAMLASAERFGVTDFVRIRGNRSSTEALQATLGAACNICVVGAAHARQVPAKIFEHISAGRPMLVVVPPESDTEALLEGIDQARCVRAEDRAELRRALVEVASGDWAGAAATVPAQLTPEVTTRQIEAVLLSAIARGSGAS